MAVAVAKGRPAARPKRRAASQRRTAGGAVWIVVMGLLLAGVVALNVAVLRLNLQYDELSRERDRLRAEKAELASELAVRAASPRTSRLARTQLGYIPADPATTTYLDLSGR
jgi:cell division protein FtsL